MRNYLIYHSKRSINSIIEEPSGCMNHIYSTLLHDMLKESFDEQLILELMNEALCISTRILIDPNPELHIKEYFEKQKNEDLLYAVEYKRFLKVMVYRIIANRHDGGQGRYQSFLKLMDYIWSLRMACLRIEGHYHAQRVYLPIDVSCLHAIVEKLCATEAIFPTPARLTARRLR